MSNWPTCPEHGNDLTWTGFGHCCTRCVIDAAQAREASR